MTRVALVGCRGEITDAVATSLRSLPIALEVFLVADQGPGLAVEKDFDTAVYLAISCGVKGRPPEPEAAAETFRAMAESGISRAIVVSSAAISPPRHVHPGMISEAEHPARGVNPVADLWAGMEAQARDRLAGLELTILRPTAVPTALGEDYISRVLGGRLAATFAGHDPSIQLLDAGDLGQAVASAVERSRGGVYNVAPDGVVPLKRALSLAGTVRLPLPRWLHRVARWSAASLGVAPLAPIAEADRIRYSWTVSNRKIKEELGFAPQLSSAAVAQRFGGGSSEEPLPEFDDFGLDKQYIALLHRTILGFLHNYYWRVELAGAGNVPRHGPAVLTGMHRGFMPFDGAMALYGLVRETGRYPRFLLHRTLMKHPILSDFMIRQGGLMACRENADRVLQRQELLGIYPEGIEGAFSYYREAYRLRRDFGRDEFVKAALRNRAPIVPFVTVGSAEIFPVLAKFEWKWWQRLTEWPCFPIAPPFPLAPVPLPSKWHTRFLEALPVHEEYPPEAARDRKVVDRISAEVRSRMESALAEMLGRRKWIFFGSIFEREAQAAKSV